MTTEFIRKGYKVTQKELSEIFNIPLATIKNWDARDCMPEYLESMMRDMIHLRKQCQEYVKAEAGHNRYATCEAEMGIIATAMNMLGVEYER